MLIEINFSIEQLLVGSNIHEIGKFYQIKNYIRDIEFCLGNIIMNILGYYCKNYPLKFEYTHPYVTMEKRLFYYILYSMSSKSGNNMGDEQKKLNESIKFNNTIVIGVQIFII